MSKRKGINKARKILKQSSITSIPINVEAIAANFGINVRREPLDDTTSGVIVIKNGRAVIGVNQDHHYYRQRFTIAHELAHFFLHSDKQEVFVSSSFSFYRDTKSADRTDWYEIEANAFAAELLMPENIIKEYLERGIDLDNELAIKRLARKFEVSQKALTYRLMNLELI